MKLNAAVLLQRARSVDLKDVVRIIRREHEATPLGMGFGKTRFASPKNAFQLVYLAEDSVTAMAETLVRDRYQGRVNRMLPKEELDKWSICEIQSTMSLKLLDLHDPACHLLHIPTDVLHARSQTAGRKFSQDLYNQTDFDGIYYPSRTFGRACFAVYDRAVVKLRPQGAAIGLPQLATLRVHLDELHLTLVA